jgi:glycosyltransferase involved in cell wall biosynthesis
VAGDSGCGEVIQRIGGGQVVPLGSVEALTMAIGRCLDTHDLWQTMAREAAICVRAEYGGAVVSARVVAMYRSLLEATGAS